MYRIWVTIPNNSSRSGYLAKLAHAHQPANAQTVPNPVSGAVFETIDDVNAEIASRGWERSTSVRPGVITAYAVHAL